MLDDGAILLRNILETPACDTARLVYADYLEEHGQGERAASIRAMIHRRGILFLDNARHRIADRGAGTELNHFAIVSAGRWPRGVGDAIRKTLPAPPAGRRTIVEVTGGFARSVARCPADWFIAHAEAIFRAHPVTAVRLADIEPAIWAPADELQGMAFWYDRGDISFGVHRHHLPRELCPLEEGLRPRLSYSRQPHSAMFFPTVVEAWAALSALCVAYGRKLAGLSPLPAAPGVPAVA